ncbi:MAG TPA: Mg2+ and Co2+ transporter CorB [Thermoclostridium caenicola]|nr:Mg2+ and Co2+ transporter CorB [Thermoclostridium caenicola]
MGKAGTEQKYMKQTDKYKKASRQNIPVKRKTGFEKRHVLWGIFITVFSFGLSLLVLFASTGLLGEAQPAFSFVVVLVIIFTGVVFDVIGIAVTAADETPFHSMASKKIRGARQSLILIRNAPRVSSFCNDVVGDICGVVSGVAGTSIVYRLFAASGDISLIETITGALIAAFTVGGKAFAKNIGMNNSNYIVYWVGRILSCFYFGKRKRG